jgi:hypothetical protein
MQRRYDYRIVGYVEGSGSIQFDLLSSNFLGGTEEDQ